MAFEALGDRLGRIVKKIRGQSTLTERNMDDMLQEVRKALLEADVSYTVVSDFISEVRSEAVGQKVLDKVSPGNMVVKIVHDKMEKLLGDGDNDAEILRAAGVSFAMGNASPAAIAAAKYRAPSVQEDGARIVLQRYVLDGAPLPALSR